MHDRIFLQVLNMSITASVVIAAVIAARLLLKKLPKVFSYALWGVVLLRLICPFVIESSWSLLPISSTPIPADIAVAADPAINTGIPALNNMINPILPVQQPEVSANPLQIWIFVGKLIWINGVTILAGYSVISLLRLRRRLIGAVRLRDNIYLADHITSPFVIGFLHPRIYIPSSLSDKEQDYVLLHEQTHLRRFDHVIKIAAYITLCIHWFNPLVWIAFILASNDMEMSCDEAVMKRLGTDIRGEYSASLLSLATGRRSITATPLAFGQGNPKKRIKNVLSYRQPRFWITALTAVLVMILGIGLSFNRTMASSKADVTIYIERVHERTVKESVKLEDAALIDYLLTTIENTNWLPVSHALYYSPKADSGYQFAMSSDSEATIKYFFFAENGKYYLYNHYTPQNGMMYKRVPEELFSTIVQIVNQGYTYSE